MKKIYLVQYEYGGIPDQPEAFLTREKAEKRFIDVVSKSSGKKIKTLGEALSVAGNGLGDDCVRIWCVMVK